MSSGIPLFNLHLPEDIRCGASFHMLICHLGIFFGKVRIKVFSTLFNQVFKFFQCWILRILCIFWRRVFYRYLFCKYFFQVCGLSSQSFNTVFCRAEVCEVKWESLSCVLLFLTPWTVAHKAPLSMGFSRQEYRSGLPFPFTGYLPDILYTHGLNLSLLHCRQILNHLRHHQFSEIVHLVVYHQTCFEPLLFYQFIKIVHYIFHLLNIPNILNIKMVPVYYDGLIYISLSFWL